MIDPKLAVSLRRRERAAVELAAIPDTDELRAADELIVRAEPTYENDAARQVKAKIARLVEQYGGGHYQLDLSNASPDELLAYCAAVEMEAEG